MVFDRDGRLALVLVDHQLERAASRGPTQAWFYLVARDASHLRAICAWTTARRDQWQAWGAMARESAEAFSAHLDALLAIEPLPAVPWGYALCRDPVDRRRLTLWGLVDQAGGREGRVAVWKRRFKNAAACSRAHAWLHEGDNLTLWHQIAVAVGEQGREAVDAFIDRSVAASL